MLIANAEIPGRGRVDVRIALGRIAALAPQLRPRPGEPALEARGGALLPGLHDHHLHLFALAAALDSVACGPPRVRDADALARALGSAGGKGWIRGVGYHESVAGSLGRCDLDALAPAGRPLRLQHRSGALWMLNGAAVERLGLDRGVDAPGVERDAAGRATGRLWRLDAWLRSRLPDAGAAPDLARVGRELARRGVTGVTDATPGNGPGAVARLSRAVDRGALPQRVLLLGAEDLPLPRHPRIARGARKLLLDDDRLPDFDAVVESIRRAHAAGRVAAIHCVTRVSLVFASEALARAGPRPGDRLEHVSVAPPELAARVAALGLTVVTQPNFVRERGDAYAVDVEPGDQPWLYRGRGWLDLGVPLAAGTDAPFGAPDPWRAMQAAVDRRSAGGRVLGAAEALSPEAALALFAGPGDAPGTAPRRLAPGAVADLCLLDRPWGDARRALADVAVAATWCEGALAFARD